MKRKTAVVLTMVAGLGVSCGGGSDSSGTGLQSADVNQIMSSVTDALSTSTQSSALTGGTAPSTALVARSADLTSSAPVNYVVACPVDGHVTTTGNVSATCPTPPATGACSFTGAITINYGDRTNNLNDCEFSNGLVIDGFLFVSLSGTGSGTAVTFTETVSGTLSLNRKGPTGGLVPISINGIGSCFVFLTANFPARTITGDVCGQSVNMTF